MSNTAHTKIFIKKPAGGDPGGGGESEEGRLVKDLVALVTSFAGKLHRRRRGQVAPAPAAV